MTPHRLRRVALQRTRKRSQRDPQDFYHGLIVEEAAIEIAVDCRLDAATQIAVGGKEALLIDTEKVLEVMARAR